MERSTEEGGVNSLLLFFNSLWALDVNVASWTSEWDHFLKTLRGEARFY